MLSTNQCSLQRRNITRGRNPKMNRQKSKKQRWIVNSIWTDNPRWHSISELGAVATGSENQHRRIRLPLPSAKSTIRSQPLRVLVRSGDVLQSKATGRLSSAGGNFVLTPRWASGKKVSNSWRSSRQQHSPSSVESGNLGCLTSCWRGHR